MGYIAGWAFEPNERELQDKNSKRFKEIQHIRESLELDKTPCYGHTKFSGTLKTDEAKALSEFDLALIADDGSLCFGGSCSKSDGGFSGRYNTD